MKILAIRIRNLASIEDTTVIDFTQEPLCSAGIFAITGPTGAGKSTILDALCLALYAKTPRYVQAKESGIEIHDVKGSTIGQGDVRGILRDATGEGFAEVDFIGVDGEAYRANWTVCRARNKPEGTLKADALTLKHIPSDKIIATGRKSAVLPEIERLVGLNFEQFTRSVLLAQGDFTAFLKASKDDKSSLLEKLTGTHIYSEISRLIFEKHKQEDLALRDLNIRKEGIATLGVEEVDAMQENKLQLENQLETYQKQAEQIQKEADWYKRLSELYSAKEAAGTVYQQALDIKKDAASRALQLKQVEQVQKTRPWIDSLQVNQQQQIQKERDVKKAEAALVLLAQQEQQLMALLQGNEITIPDETSIPKDVQPFLKEAGQMDAMVESTRLFSGIEQLHTWKKDNSTRQPIVENKSLIISKLADAQTLVEQQKAIAQDFSATGKKIKGQEVEQKKWREESVRLHDELKTICDAYETQQTTIKAIAIESLKAEKDNIDQSLEDLIRGHAHWDRQYGIAKELNGLQENIVLHQHEIQAKQLAVEQVIKELEIARIKRETTAKTVEKARLAAAEAVEQLRTQLVNDEPCPVCGSKEHPYAIHDPGLNKVLKEIEKEHAENEKNYEDYLTKRSTLETAYTHLQQLIERHQKEIADKTKALGELEQMLISFTVYPSLSIIPDEQKSAWLQEQTQQLKKKQQTVNNQIQFYYNGLQQLETQKNKIDQLNKEVTDVLNKEKDTLRVIQSQQEHLAHYTQEKEKINEQLSEVEQLLAPYFPGTDWINNWKANPTSFLTKINDFTEQWKQKIEKLEHDIQKHHTLISTVIVKQKTQKEQTEKDIQALQQHIVQLNEQIQQWLAEYNDQNTAALDFNQLNNLLTFSETWINAERTALRAIDDAVTKAISILNERTTALQQHEEKRLSDNNFEAITALQEETKNLLNNTLQSKNEIDFKLQQNEENNRKIGDLLKDINKQSVIVENWAKLNDVIGSADGKKFRQIAQEYTLDILLEYANLHLEKLSNRYAIQRTLHSLGLQVLDKDMGNEIRTVHSLSGGESFLVSLALALGLASLSSNKMKVESLFIDEGFGSLDLTTLNIAMDALERLHNQGRKVGVISHVQEMTERIPVQVTVSKQANGKSRIEVLGI